MTTNNNNNIENEEMNEIIILDEVLQTIAAHTAKETKGITLISSCTEGIMEKLVKKSTNKAVRVTTDDKNVSIEIHVAVEHGIKIPEICVVLQTNIKRDIEEVTDLTVKKVDVYVDSITIKENEKSSQDQKNTEKQENE